LQVGRLRRSARADESARLEIVCGATHRGFKSHLLRSAFRRGLSPSSSDAIPAQSVVSSPCR
jgi:hypothetical protein